MVLRCLTLRLVFPLLPVFERDHLLKALSTSRSPIFSEFVLELGGLPVYFSRSSSEHWGCWEEIDNFLEEFSRHDDFRFIIRTDKPYDLEVFQSHAREAFPSLASKGCIYFEMAQSIGNI